MEGRGGEKKDRKEGRGGKEKRRKGRGEEEDSRAFPQFQIRHYTTG